MTASDFVAWAGLPESAAQAMAEWEMHPLVVDGIERGGAAVRGTEIHVAIAPKWRYATIARQRVRTFLAPLMGRAGFLTTRVVPNPVHHRFLSRLGFAKTWQQPGIDHYMLCALPFAARGD